MNDNILYKKNTVSGIKWTLLNQIISQTITFVLSLVLMRLITPKEFGLLGMITVFSGFLSVFKDFGFGSSLIQKKNLKNIDVNTIYWTTVAIGALLTTTLILFAPLIANYYNELKLFDLTLALSSVFLLQSFSSVQLSLAKKEMKFKLIFKVNTVSVLIASILSLVLAYLDFGVWALVFQQVIGTLLISIGFYIFSNYKPSFIWSLNILKSHLKFSLPLVGRGSINYWSRNADNFFIGKFMGAELLGIYTRSYAVMMMPVSRISGVLSSVLFPSLSLIQDDLKRINKIFLKVTKTIAFITFPLMLILLLGAKDFVVSLFGENWLKMIPVLQILSIIGAIQSLGTLNGNIFLVKNRTDIAFKINMINSSVYIIGFYFSSHYNLIFLTQIYLFSNLVLLILNWYVVERLMKLPSFSLLNNVKTHIIFFIYLGIFGYYLLLPFMDTLGLNGYINLLILFFIVFLKWVLLFYFFNRGELKSQINLLKNII
ncbi:lipopolysaccharide biosynthesis protein [Croceibacter atlanticus]|jgi:PST family polysaccharide transporter|uniref:lipopolysaccharide biosynthesis protein n=1 Tax=Croceibacter atlanticus TaxID=313588 RepID=UPI0030F8C9EE